MEFIPIIYAVPVDGRKADGGSAIRADIGVAAYAAHGLDLLIRARPALRPALTEARQSVEGMRNVSRIIDSVGRGLYGYLMMLRNTPADFNEGLSCIKALLRAE